MKRSTFIKRALAALAGIFTLRGLFGSISTRPRKTDKEIHLENELALQHRDFDMMAFGSGTIRQSLDKEGRTILEHVPIKHKSHYEHITQIIH